jgi:UDP-N-acetylglucosamine--N-acetylmuramyl-(pentapeptide) pyrophosphoryl-undecaprenol N-acetylglucosamine transferase
MSTFVIACGGTGGHLSPGIALAESLERYGHKCYLVISKKPVDQEYKRKYPQFRFVEAPGTYFSLNPIQFVKFCCCFVKSLTFCIHTLQEIKPDLVIGFGGFMSVGTILAAFILGCPTAIHESNRVPGKAVRLLSRITSRVYLPEGVYIRGIPVNTIRHYGYPLRDSIQKVQKDAARIRLGLSTRGKVLAIIGGSQGSVALNNWLRKNMEQLLEEDVSVYAITGKVDGGVASKAVLLEKGDARIICEPFTDQMGDILSAADIVVSRAGAGTIAELTCCQVPAILIPYPSSADNHQQANAVFLEKQGGGVVLDQAKLDSLYEEVMSIIFNDWLLGEFRRNLGRLSRVSSLALMIEDLEKMASQNLKMEDSSSKTSV